jgi:plasmid stability protein
MASSSTSQPHEVVYVRVLPEDKARLRAYADRAHNGSMAKAIRHILDAYIADQDRPRGRHGR